MKKRFDFLWRNTLNECSAMKRRAAQGVLGATFFSTVGVGAFTFALSVNAESAGFSQAWLGLAFSGYFLARLILAPLAGYGADRIGALPLLLAATGAGAIIPALYSIFMSNETLGVIQIVLGFCAGIIKPVSMSLLGECAPQHLRGRFFGAYNTCLYAAFVIGPLAGGLATNIHGGIGLTTFLWPGLGMGISFILFLRARKLSPTSVKQNNYEKSGPPWRNVTFLALLSAVLGRTMGSAVIITFLPRLINERFGISGIAAALLFALPNIMIILGMPFTSQLADSHDKIGLTFLGMGLCAACLFGFGQPLPLFAFAGLSLAMGIGSALSLPSSMSLASDLGAAKGSIMGIFIGASNLGFVLGPSLAGFAADHGGMADAFELTALFGGLCLFPILVVMAKVRHVQ